MRIVVKYIRPGRPRGGQYKAIAYRLVRETMANDYVIAEDYGWTEEEAEAKLAAKLLAMSES